MSWDAHGLEGRTVVVTGAGSGIGEAIATAFAELGSNVVAGDRDEAALAAVSAHANVSGVAADLGQTAGCERLIEAAVDAHGTVDVLVNNVGISPLRTSFLETSDADWDEMLSVNLLSMVRCARAAIPHMLEREKGAIVSIASDFGRAPDPMFIDYSVSKAAVLSLSKALSKAYGGAGIRSNVVSPGPTRTGLWDRPGGFADLLAEQFGTDREGGVQKFVEMKNLPLGRLGRPADVANAVVFVASDLAGQVTGSEYCVNGGVLDAA